MDQPQNRDSARPSFPGVCSYSLLLPPLHLGPAACTPCHEQTVDRRLVKQVKSDRVVPIEDGFPQGGIRRQRSVLSAPLQLEGAALPSRRDPRVRTSSAARRHGKRQAQENDKNAISARIGQGRPRNEIIDLFVSRPLRGAGAAAKALRRHECPNPGVTTPNPFYIREPDIDWLRVCW